MKLTVKELAQELGVTTQAIHFQIKTHEDVREHIEKEGRIIVIDEVGQDLIRERSIGRPQSLMTDKTVVEERDQLLRENSALKDRIMALQTELYTSAQAVALANENQRLLEESRINVKQLMESNIKKDKEIDVLEGYIRDSKENYRILEEEKNEEIGMLKRNNKKLEDYAEKADVENMQLKEENSDLMRKFQKEKTRKLTLGERLTGKKKDVQG